MNKKTVSIVLGATMVGGLIGMSVPKDGMEVAQIAVAESVTVEKTSTDSIKVIRQKASVTPDPTEQNYSQEYIDKRRVEIENRLQDLEVEKTTLQDEQDFLTVLETKLEKLKINSKEVLK